MSPRKSRHIPTSSGVYQIRYNQNGKVLASEQLWIDKTVCAAGRNWGLWCIRDSSPLAVQW